VTDASDSNYEVESVEDDVEDEEGEVPESPASLQAPQVEAEKFSLLLPLPLLPHSRAPKPQRL